jgi:hypothetical protein
MKESIISFLQQLAKYVRMLTVSLTLSLFAMRKRIQDEQQASPVLSITQLCYLQCTMSMRQQFFFNISSMFFDNQVTITQQEHASFSHPSQAIFPNCKLNVKVNTYQKH